MSNSFGLLLLAILVLFVICRCLRSPKLFITSLACLAASLVVGAGVKHIVNLVSDAAPMSSVILIKSPCSTYDYYASIVENASCANLDRTSKDLHKGGDNFINYTNALPTTLNPVSFINDS